MKIGDLVTGANGYVFASGAERYSDAVCVSVEPLIVISKRGDMRWNRLDKEHVESVGVASESDYKNAMERLERDNQSA